MQFIPLTPQLGELIKSFRIRNEKTAKDISSIIKKTPSYLSKIESGATKKIETSVFTSMCNAITDSSEGIKQFVSFAFQNDAEYDKDTSIILSNIDDILYKFIPPKELLSYVVDKMTSNNISISDLLKELNANKDLSDLSETVYDSLPYNVYAYTDVEKNNSAIKLSYDSNTIENLLEKSTETNYVTLEAILYSLYKLCGKPAKDARINAIKTLNDRFHVISVRKERTIIITSKEDEEKYLGKLEPNVEENFHQATNGIRIALLLSQSKGGAERIEILKKNMKADLGFTFSFISTDLEKLFPLSKDLKKDFLRDLNKLIDDYANRTDDNVDFFFDD